MGKESKATTTLQMDKECKNSARFKSVSPTESVTTSVYLLNKAWGKLGKPTKIKAVFTAVEE
jgi:hypothetical protein